MPSRKRNVSSTAVKIDGSGIILMDCGEGTQRQMMHSGLSFMKVRAILLSHFHGDHLLGIPGLLQSMQLSGRSEDLIIMGPDGVDTLVEIIAALGPRINSFEIKPVRVRPGEDRSVLSLQLKSAWGRHGVPVLAYRLDAPERQGRFRPERAISLGIEPGPLFGRLQRNIPVVIEGRTITPEMVMGRKRKGASIGYAVDTRPTQDIIRLMHGVSVLIHDSTFGPEMQRKAMERGHSTCTEAAEVAKEASVRRLFLTHISARYEDDRYLRDEARRIFRNSYVAHDFLKYRIPVR